MPHTVSFIQDEKDPSVLHEFLVNLGPLGIKEEEEEPDPASLAWDDVVMVTGLKNRDDINDSAARVLADHPREDGRIPIEMFLGMERVWIKRANLLGPIPDVAALTHEPYSRMSDVERTDVGMFFFANQNSTRSPGVRGRSVPTMGIGEGTDDDPFAGLKQHMEADGFDTSNMQTFSMKPGAHGTGATLEECLANAQASTQ